MKKIFILLFLSVAVAGFGQKTLYFGLGGMYGLSGVVNQNTYGQPELDYDAHGAYGGNLNIGYNFTKHLGIKVEVGFARLGQKYFDKRGEAPNDTDFTRKIDLNYLTVPILFKYNTKGKIARFYVLAGPQLGILMGAKQEYLADGVQYDHMASDLDGNAFNVSEPDIKDRLSSFDLMARVDLGADITLVKNLFLNIGITMNYGFMDLNDKPYRMNDFSGNYNKSHNFYGALNMGLNYCIPFK